MPDIDSDGRCRGLYAMSFDITARKETERRLATSEHLLRGITDNLPALVCYVDVDDRYRFANATYHAWLGFDHRAMVGRTVDEFFDADTRRTMAPFVARGRAGEHVSFERHDTSHGRDVYYVVEYIPDVDDEGRVLGLYAMTTDITVRRKAELELVASEKLLLDITNSIPAVIGRFDMAERCLFSNDIGLRVHGLTRDDLPTLTFRSHIDADLIAQHDGALRTVLAGAPATVHGTRRMKGEDVWFNAHLIPERDDAGRAARVST